jgi:protein-S-isoprenylcysteine O-methyltransferase Ste14
MTARSFSVLGLLGAIAFQALVGVLAFVCAGRWDLPMFWAFFGACLAAMLFGALLADPDLARERIKPRPGGKDYGTTALLTAYWVGQPALAGLDVGRFHWSDGVPLEVQIFALVVMTAALALLVWAVTVNRFFSSVLRIQTERGHHVINTGPYGYVRHPGYAAALFLGVAGGVTLGSWLAALVGLLMVGPLIRRTLQEDRMLHDQLEGYTTYAQQVRYRLFPGLW